MTRGQLYSVPMNLSGLVYLGMHERAIDRCRTHPEEVSQFFDQSILRHGGDTFISVLYWICNRGDKEIPINLLKVMLEINPEVVGWCGKQGHSLCGTALSVVVKRLFSLSVIGEDARSWVENLSEALRLMLEAKPEGASIAASDYPGTLPLNEALRCNGLARTAPSHFISSFRRIFNAYPDAVSCRNRQGRFSLHIACIYNRHYAKEASEFIFSLLLGAYPDAAKERDSYKKFPLHYQLDFESQIETNRVLDAHSLAALDLLLPAASQGDVLLGADDKDRTPFGQVCQTISELEESNTDDQMQKLEALAMLKMSLCFLLLKENPEVVNFLNQESW
eukprot:CAMPEP_0196822376 /NCGR_PEP_ID=MMETSP1362-20130617/83203_1 /TAXON_ID=163516 /ORGANISM="Leptocylindrus danicus, Strain CCMP1856" /LENGTH=334 /DNA_ID=CAMNT_0042201917 /DNA_START=270 /DNA_END=1271 /DNA_ORIENTATION=-